jgi:hypothetical protein
MVLVKIVDLVGRAEKSVLLLNELLDTHLLGHLKICVSVTKKDKRSWLSSLWF